MNTHYSLPERLITLRFSLKTESFDFKYLPLIALSISYLLNTDSTVPLGCVSFGLFSPGCLVLGLTFKTMRQTVPSIRFLM